MTRRAALGKMAKIVFSLALLAAIFAHVGPRLVLEQLAGMDKALVALAFALLLTEALARALNWFQLIRDRAPDVALRTAVHAHFVGGYFGALLPSTLGTDVARSALLAMRSEAPAETFLAMTVLLNVLNLAVISATALASCMLVLHWPAAPGAVIAISAAVSGGCLLGIVAAWTRARRMRAPRVAADAGSAATLRVRLARRFTQFIAALVVLPRGWHLAGVAAVATLSYGLRSLGWLVLLLSVGASVPWLALLTIGPLITLGAALPISVLGFGGFQAISVFLLAQWGVLPQHALAASLVQSGLAVLLYAIGCVGYIAGGKGTLPTLVRNDRSA
jgi:glycosyltransferase 2 family protein